MFSLLQIVRRRLLVAMSNVEPLPMGAFAAPRVIAAVRTASVVLVITIALQMHASPAMEHAS